MCLCLFYSFPCEFHPEWYLVVWGVWVFLFYLFWLLGFSEYALNCSWHAAFLRTFKTSLCWICFYRMWVQRTKSYKLRLNMYFSEREDSLWLGRFHDYFFPFVYFSSKSKLKEKMWTCSSKHTGQPWKL